MIADELRRFRFKIEIFGNPDERDFVYAKFFVGFPSLAAWIEYGRATAIKEYVRGL